eukprot:scaffold34_cov271-Prasinococcus_capsulatus_cf.AAC.13
MQSIHSSLAKGAPKCESRHARAGVEAQAHLVVRLEGLVVGVEPLLQRGEALLLGVVHGIEGRLVVLADVLHGLGAV